MNTTGYKIGMQRHNEDDENRCILKRIFGTVQNVVENIHDLLKTIPNNK